ncbi:MAG: hypothetical protein AABX38_02505 [Candidatus Micrarchaeota archaeon]
MSEQTLSQESKKPLVKIRFDTDTQGRDQALEQATKLIESSKKEKSAKVIYVNAEFDLSKLKLADQIAKVKLNNFTSLLRMDNETTDKITFTANSGTKTNLKLDWSIQQYLLYLISQKQGQTYTLPRNFFIADKNKLDTEGFVKRIFEGGKINVNVRVEIIQKDAVAANGTTSDKRYIVLERTSGKKYEYLAFTPANNRNTSKKELRILAKDSIELGRPIKNIYIAAPYSCIGFVNKVLEKSGANKVKPSPAIDFNRSNKGESVFVTSEEVTKRGKIDGTTIEETLKAAHKGDIILCFTSLISREQMMTQGKGWEKFAEAKATEYTKINGAQSVVWKGNVPYIVGHAAIYAGKNEKGEHMINQAHIGNGLIVSEPITPYFKIVLPNHFNAFAIISYDYFKDKKSTEEKLAAIPKRSI